MAYNGRGDGLTVVVPDAGGAVPSGEGVVIGGRIGVAAEDGSSGNPLTCYVKGEFEMPKLSTDNMTLGQLVNWNDTTKEWQAATSTLDGVGYVSVAAPATQTFVLVIINF